MDLAQKLFSAVVQVGKAAGAELLKESTPFRGQRRLFYKVFGWNRIDWSGLATKFIEMTQP